MNEELQSLIDRAMAAGRSPGQIISALKQNGLDDGGIMSADSYIKKKSPSDLGESSSPLDLRPSVSESLGSERVQIGFDDAAIQQKKKAISDAAAAQVYTAVAKTGGDLNKIEDKQAFADAYTTYRSMSDDPMVSSLPQNPVAQNGQIDFAVVPTLKKGATEYINDLIKQEQDRKAKLGEKITVPVLTGTLTGVEKTIGTLLKFNEMVTGKNSELADFFLDDAEVRGRDAKIDYGNSEEEISKGFINNLLEGNIKAAFVNFGVDLTQQVPQLAVVAMTGGAGLPLLATSAAGGGYASLEGRSDLSEGEKMLYGIGVGAAEYLAERLFLGDINAIRKALGKEGVESLTKKELGDMMFGALPKGVRSVMEEGTEELLTSVAQQTLGKIIAGEEFNPIEIAESAIYGGTLGGSIYLLSRGSGAIVNPENEAKIQDLKKDLNKTQQAKSRPDIAEEEREILSRKEQETRQAINDFKAKDDNLVARMSEEDRVVLKGIQDEISSIRRKNAVVKTEEGKQQLKKESLVAIQKLNNLKTKYDTQEEAGIPSPVVEGEAPIEVQPIEGASQETPQAGGVLQVPIEEVVVTKEEVGPAVEDITFGTAFDLQDKTAERTVSDKNAWGGSGLIRERIENAGDILRELSSRGDRPDPGYIQEKIDKLRSWIPDNASVRSNAIPSDIKTIDDFNNTNLRFSNVTDGFEYLMKFNSDVVNKIRSEYETIPTYTKEQKLAKDSVLALLNQDITGLEKNLDSLQDVVNTIEREGKLEIVKSVEPPIIESLPQEVTSAPQQLTESEEIISPIAETVVTEEVIEQVVEQEPIKNKKGLSGKQVTEAVSGAERLVKRLGLPTKIIIHNSRKEFNDAMDEVSKSGSVASGVESGRFIPSRNEIHLNLEDMTSEVPFHEVFHAAFVNRFGKASQATREKIASDFQSGLLRVLRSGTAEDQQLADAVERFVKDGEYSAKESPEEFMAQTAGFIATSGKKISKTTMDNLIQWLNNFIGKVSPSLKVTTRGEFIDFMNSFSGALFEAGTDSRDVSEVVSEIDEASSKQSDPKAIDAALAIVKNVNNKYPEAVEQQVVSAEFKEDKFGKKGTLYDVKSIPYKLSDGAKRYFGENAVEKLSDKIVSDVKKYEGNKDISKGIGWYSNFRTQFQRKFGASLELFGQLLAATSAQTPVDVNFRQAIDALRQYSKGSYDKLIKDYSKYVDSIEKMSRQDIIDSIEVRTKRKKANYTDLDIINEKRKLINEFKDVPLQSNGKKFNANSAKVLQAIYGNWLSQTQGPKTKNFAGNLTGRSYDATIDVWAARYLRRIIYKDNVSRWRIHPKQEGAVEHTVSVDGVTGGDYFFAEEVMRNAAEKLNWNADDLQAFLWFLEKDIWSRNNWTGAAGRKKSSFEEEAEKLLTERYQAGVTTFKDFGTFNKEEFEAAKVELLNTIRAVDGLIVGRVVESEGEYYSPSGDVYAEPTFDVEFSVDEGTDVSSIEAKVIEIGKRYNQEAVLFSKITEKKEKNSAPIIEIGLKNPSKNSKTIDSIKKMLSGLGIRGFTVSRDSQGNILGVRTQYIKEFEGQPISFGEILFSNAETELRNQFEKNNDISYISSNFVETNVTFTENEKATEIPSDAKAKDDAGITGGLESSSRVAGEPSGPSRAGAAGGITESSSRDVREEILDKEQLSFKQRAVNTAKTFVWSDTQKQIRVFKERMSSQIAEEGIQITKFTKSLNKLLKKADVQTINLVGDIFDKKLTPENQTILESKPNGSLIFGQANAMRNYIDSFAEEFVNSPEFHAMPEETVNIIVKNFGQYMRGSYRFWKDKNFKPSNAARRDAIAYEYEILRAKSIGQLTKLSGLTESEADDFFELLHDETLAQATKVIDDYIADIEKIRNGSDFKKLGIVSPSGIKLPSEQFLRRKELPETIQNLLGKERDPIIRFIDTTIALSNIKYKGHMLYAISESLGGTQFIKNEVTDAEKSTGEYKEVKDKFSPLNGRFVHRDVYEAITNQNIYESDNIWMSGYLTTLQLARKSKVIYNLPSWRKNLTGGWYTMAANGVINPSLVRDIKRRAELFATGETDQETEDLRKIMANNGLLAQDVNANLLGFTNAIYSRTLTGNDKDYNSYVDRARNLIKNFDSVIGQKYAAIDDYTKLVIFRSEIQSFAKKMYGKPYDSLTEAQKNKVHAEAAEFVKQNTPTFSRLPKWYASLAKLPAGDFLSFEFESLRSFGTNILNGRKDLMKGMTDKTLTPEQKAEYIKAGSRRLAGSAAILGARLAITSILASLALGDDDELEEDIKNNRPNWMEGHSIIPTKVSKEGIATVYDYSMEDPYGSFFDLTTDPLSFPSYIVDLLQPNMGISFLTNLAENKDFYGRDITNSYDDPLTKGYKYGGHTLKSLIIPPFIASSYRDEQKRLEAEADKYSPLDAVGRVASRAVIRDYEYNIPVQFYYFTDQFRTKKEQYSDLTGASRDNRLAELDEIKKMYKSITNIGIKKGNYKMIADANKNVKRALKPAEEAYVLYGYEIPEKK